MKSIADKIIERTGILGFWVFMLIYTGFIILLTMAFAPDRNFMVSRIEEAFWLSEFIGLLDWILQLVDC